MHCDNNNFIDLFEKYYYFDNNILGHVSVSLGYGRTSKLYWTINYCIRKYNEKIFVIVAPTHIECSLIYQNFTKINDKNIKIKIKVIDSKFDINDWKEIENPVIFIVIEKRLELLNNITTVPDLIIFNRSIGFTNKIKILIDHYNTKRAKKYLLVT